MNRTTTSLSALALAAFLAAPALAQEKQDPPPEEQPAKQPDKTTEKQPEKDPLTGLDAALGLKDEIDVPIETLLIDPAEEELNKELSGAEMADAFIKAAALMGDTASRIELAGDTGIITQRLQEDILRSLDQIIESAKQQQQNSSSSSSSSSSQSQSPQQQKSNKAGDGENKGQADPPARQEGGLNAAGAGTGATWGALPDRVREALSQGQSGRFSSLYRSLTEAYYRRLAEEAGK